MPATTLNRRESDQVVELLRERIDTTEERTQHINDELSRHIAECAVLQKKVLFGIAVIFGWMVAHSPEVAKVLGMVLK